MKCPHCGREFQQQQRWLRHSCEQLRRWNQRHSVAAVLAIQLYQQFVRMLQPRTQVTWQQFSKCRYYSSFLKFAQYVLSVRCVDSAAYLDFLLRQRVPQSRWCSDHWYQQFLLHWVIQEPAWNSVLRSVLSAQRWAETQHCALHEYFARAGTNQICWDLQRAQVTGWLVYSSASGQRWLHSLPAQQLPVIWPWISADRWQPVLQSSREFAEISTLVQQLGF